jgi:hypothetical protein
VFFLAVTVEAFELADYHPIVLPPAMMLDEGRERRAGTLE